MKNRVTTRGRLCEGSGSRYIGKCSEYGDGQGILKGTGFISPKPRAALMSAQSPVVRSGLSYWVTLRRGGSVWGCRGGDGFAYYYHIESGSVGAMSPAISTSYRKLNGCWVEVWVCLGDIGKDWQPKERTCMKKIACLVVLLGMAAGVSAALTTTTTTISSSLNPSTYGQSVTFTATVSSSQGAPPDGETITFLQGTTTLGTASLSGGSAAFPISTLTGGTDNIKAQYGGDATFGSSKSRPVAQVVNPAPTTTTLTS